MSNLADLVDALKRELAVPGEFDTIFPNTSDDDLAGALADAFGQAQLEGFFGSLALDSGAGTVTPDLSVAGGALVVLIAGERTIRAQLRNLKAHVRYEAAGTVYEANSAAASVLAEELKSFSDRRKDLYALIQRQGRANTAVYMTDAYLVRAQAYFPSAAFGEIAGFYAWEIPTYSRALA